MGIGRIMGEQGMNIQEMPRHPPDKERGRVLQMLWNFLSITIITVLLYQWPDPPSALPEPPFAEEWPTIIEMMDWAGTNDGTGLFRKETQDAYEDKWEIWYGIGTQIMREIMLMEEEGGSDAVD